MTLIFGKWYQSSVIHFFRGPYTHTIYQEDLHLDTNMRNQLYLETQIFIHHNLVQHKTFTLFMWHPAIKLLLYMTTILETSICYSMARGEGSTLLIGLHGSYVFFPCVHLLHTSYKISNSRIFLMPSF